MIAGFTQTHRNTITPDQLLKLVEDCLAAYSLAFGVQWMTPKYHWLLHFGDHLRQVEMLVACFVHERKHKIDKRYVEKIMSDIIFERGVLAEVQRLYTPNMMYDLRSTEHFCECKICT